MIVFRMIGDSFYLRFCHSPFENMEEMSLLWP